MTQDAPVRCLVELQRILRRFQINHKQSVMLVLLVDVRLALWVGAWIQRRRERSTLLSCLCLFQNLLTQVLHMSWNLRF